MKKGDRVKIYEDPFTCKKLEGTAELMHFVGRYQNNERAYETWVVRFDDGIDDDIEVIRIIKKGGK